MRVPKSTSDTIGTVDTIQKYQIGHLADQALGLVVGNGRTQASLLHARETWMTMVEASYEICLAKMASRMKTKRKVRRHHRHEDDRP